MHLPGVGVTNLVWKPVAVTLLMILGALVAWSVLTASRRLVPQNPSKEKNKTYGCGEEVQSEETKADSERFYSPIKRVFGKFYSFVRPSHSGDLNSYLTWVVAGMIIVFILILMEVG